MKSFLPPPGCGLGSILGAALLTFAGLASVGAQTISFSSGSIAETPTNTSGFLNQYRALIGAEAPGGGVVNNLTYPAYNVTVTDGADGGELLIGQSFLAVCVNISYPGLSAGDFSLSTDGSSLSYDIDGAGTDFPESWDWTSASAQQAVKYNAMRDIIATHGSALVSSASTDPTQFQYRVTALNFVLAEIGVDGIADIDPLSTGNMQFSSGGAEYDADFAAVLGYYNEYLAAIGNGEGADYVLYSAGVTGVGNQDVILIPVPEPTIAALAGAAGLIGLVRRRRTV